jgi:hypothetical protein
MAAERAAPILLFALLACSSGCSSDVVIADQSAVPSEVRWVAVLFEDQSGNVFETTPLLPYHAGLSVHFDRAPAQERVVGFSEAALTGLVDPATDPPLDPVRVVECGLLPAPTWVGLVGAQGGAVTPTAAPPLSADWLTHGCAETVMVDDQCTGFPPMLVRGDCAVGGPIPGGNFSAEYNKNGVLCFDAATLAPSCKEVPSRRGSIGSLDCASTETAPCTVDLYVAGAERLPIQVRTATVYPVQPGYTDFFCDMGGCNPLPTGYLFDAAVLTDRVAALGFFPRPFHNDDAPSELRFFGKESLALVAIATSTPELGRIVADRPRTGLYGLTSSAGKSIDLIHLDAVGRRDASWHLADVKACFVDLRELQGASERIAILYTAQTVTTGGCGIDGVATDISYLALFDPSTGQLTTEWTRQATLIEADTPIDEDRLALAIGVVGTVSEPPKNQLLIVRFGDATPELVHPIPTIYVGAMDFDSALGVLLVSQSSPKGPNLASLPFDANGAPGLLVEVADFELAAGARQSRPGPLTDWPHRPNTELIGLVRTQSSSAAGSYLALYDKANAHFLPGVLPLGDGPTSNLLPDGPNRIWTFLPWAAQLVRLDFEAPR